MTRLLLIRHAKPAANWDVSDDAGLDSAGHAQAAALPAVLASRGPVAIVTSPLRRTRETAAPLAEAWGIEPAIDPALGEIAAPGIAMQERSAWLRVVMAARWADLDGPLHSWRTSLLAALTALPADTVVVTHFVAINTVVGACTGTDRVLSFSPAHASITEIDVVNGALHLVARGAEADTSVR